MTLLDKINGCPLANPNEDQQVEQSMKLVDAYLRQRDCANTEDMLAMHELVSQHGTDKHRVAYHRLRNSALLILETVGRKLTGDDVGLPKV